MTPAMVCGSRRYKPDPPPKKIFIKSIDKNRFIVYNKENELSEVTTMEKNITVRELREQLATLERLGKGDAIVVFRDWNDIDLKFEEGVYDVVENKVVLG